jgi:hypothetical protein
MAVAFAYAAVFVGSMYAAAIWAPLAEVTTWVAAAGGVCLLALGPTIFVLALGRAAAGRLVRMLGVPLMITAISLTPTVTMLFTLPHGEFWDVMTIALGTLTFGGTYFVLVRKLAEPEWEQLGLRVFAASPQRYRRLAAVIMGIQPYARAA